MLSLDRKGETGLLQGNDEEVQTVNQGGWTDLLNLDCAILP
jgi:hypothetical protein